MRPPNVLCLPRATSSRRDLQFHALGTPTALFYSRPARSPNIDRRVPLRRQAGAIRLSVVFWNTNAATQRTDFTSEVSTPEFFSLLAFVFAPSPVVEDCSGVILTL